MIRQSNVICLFAIITLLCSRAYAEQPRPSEHWHVEAAPESRLVHGWMLIQKDGDSFVVHEHTGGGTDQNGLSDPVDLSFSWFREEGAVRLSMSRRIGKDNGGADVTSTPSIPTDAELRVREQQKVAAITGKYQVLWRADVVRKNEVVSTLVYVARLAPNKDGVDGFSGGEVTKALDVVKKAEAMK